ncbi:UNVERIFIED_CONTAM: hypothetical protein K2H54_026276 [Gekko kuhli]
MNAMITNRYTPESIWETSSRESNSCARDICMLCSSNPGMHTQERERDTPSLGKASCEVGLELFMSLFHAHTSMYPQQAAAPSSNGSKRNRGMEEQGGVLATLPFINSL